jgi:hypothetical protein
MDGIFVITNAALGVAGDWPRGCDANGSATSARAIVIGSRNDAGLELSGGPD